MWLVAEFTTEPFVGEGSPPPHAAEALRVIERAGLSADFGPFGTSMSGERDVLLPVVADVLAAALAHGATRVSLQVARADD